MSKHKLGVVRAHLSPDLLRSAFLHAKSASVAEARAIEGSSEDGDDLWAYAMSSIQSAVSFLEATINELYYVASDTKLSTERMSREQKTRLSVMWKAESFRRHARTLDRYQTALDLLGIPLFDEGAEPYQSAKLSITLRNALVHYVPETHEVSLEEERGELVKLEKQLRGRFAPNPLISDFPVVVSAIPDQRGQYPFFPFRCLGYGCAKWAVTSCLAFADDFFNRIKISWHYRSVVESLPTLP